MGVEAVAQVGQAVLQAADVHRQSHPVGVLRAAVQPGHCAVAGMAAHSLLCHLCMQSRACQQHSPAQGQLTGAIVQYMGIPQPAYGHLAWMLAGQRAAKQIETAAQLIDAECDGGQFSLSKLEG